MENRRGWLRGLPLALVLMPMFLHAQTTISDWWIPIFDRNSMRLPELVKIGDGLVVDWTTRTLLAPGTNPSNCTATCPEGPMGPAGPQGIPGPVGPQGPPGSGTGSTRIYGERLTRTASGNWLIPLGAIPATLVLTVDRWPVYNGIDYYVVGQEIVPMYPWINFANKPPGNQLVMCDFDR